MNVGKYEFEIKVDTNMPENEVKFVDKDGKELGRIINIGVKEDGE